VSASPAKKTATATSALGAMTIASARRSANGMARSPTAAASPAKKTATATPALEAMTIASARRSANGTARSRTAAASPAKKNATASSALATIRIASTRRSANGMPRFLARSLLLYQQESTATIFRVDDELVGNDTAQEVDEDHHALTQALITHYSLQFADKQIMWPKSALKLRGKVDSRPLEPGGVELEEGEIRHALLSDTDYSSDDSN